MVFDNSMSNLRKLQLLQLDIAKTIKEICEKNGISYFLIGGSLLGAIRHKGFIPWDDDLDIGMLRPNYERFLKVAPQFLNKDKFFLETWDTEKGYGFPFAKIKLNNTNYTERNATNTQTHRGIFVDVFPIDIAAPKGIARKIHLMSYQIPFKFFLYKKGYVPRVLHGNKSIVKTLVAKIMSLVAKPIPDSFWKMCINKIACKYSNSSNQEYAVTLFGAYGYKEICSLDGLRTTTNVPFENDMFSIPVAYDEYLRNMYGDYMQLPPENKRYNRHGDYNNIDFGEYR